VRCPGCDAENPAEQKFCNACGEQLRPAASETEGPTEPRSSPPDHLAEKIRAGGKGLEGERKQVTVLFGDVMGSMQLAESVDPEEWQGIMDRFFAILSDGVHLFEGTVDKFTGDGIMALFGAPIAHEDHAQRACFTALHLIDRLGEFSAELRRSRGLNFLVRIGINSGEVVVGGIGEDLGMEYTAVGHTVGLAQRMEQLAEPGKAYVSDDTATLVTGYLALDDLGEFEVKGASEPMRVHELTGVGPARGRLDISQARGFARFVGRDEEMATLEAAFEQAREGNAQVVGIVGEPGVGKSRLCHEFVQHRRAKGVPVYHTTGQAHAQWVSLMPVMHLMRSYFDVTEQDSDQRARERIAGRLLLLDESLVDDLPLIFEFLAVPDPERPAGLMDPEARRRELLGLVRRLIRAQAGSEPGITLVEDLHWLDPASEIFLANHIDAVQGTQSLTIVNFRPEYQAHWMSKPYYSQIALVPLGSEAIAEMLEDLLGSHASLAGLPDLLTGRTGGNPFFIEELMRSLVEAGNLEGEHGAFKLVRPIETTVVPASVQVVLASRIDRLEAREKAVLQAASVIGKEFSPPVLERVVDLEPPQLEEALRELVAAGFVFEQEIYPESIYAFRHPLTQEVAYGSQLGEGRATAHGAVARAIAEQYPDRLEERSALLAQHWESAGETLESARCHARAATWTGTRDPAESLRHWRKVVELADALPESEETIALGLGARMFSLQFAWRLGISHEEAEEVFEEAERLAAKSGDLRSRAFLLSVYAGIKGITDGDAQGMVELGTQAVALAEETGDPALLINTAGVSYGFFLTGEYRRGIAVLDRAIEVAESDPEAGGGLTAVSPLGSALIFKGGYLTTMGGLEEGRELSERGMKLCAEKEDIETIGWGHMWMTWNTFFAGEPEAALSHARQALDIAERRGDSFSRTWSWTWLGGAELAQGHWTEAIAACERALELSRELRTAVDSNTWSMLWLAEAKLGNGEVDRGIEIAREARGLAVERSMRTSEVYGSLVLARLLIAATDGSVPAEAEEELGRALKLCRELECGAIEPLVHVEVAELARRRGDAAARERELSEAHSQFVENGASAHADRLAGELAALAG
jgi:class 3 adenylate cyclase/tetratricopeptide (TPR) repeat protein